MRPKRAKMAPKRAKMRPKTTKMTPKMAEMRPKMAWTRHQDGQKVMTRSPRGDLKRPKSHDAEPAG